MFLLSITAEGPAAAGAARPAAMSQCWRLMGGRGVSRPRQTDLPHLQRGVRRSPQGRAGPGMGQLNPDSRKHLLGFVFLPVAGEDGCFQKPPQSPATVEGPPLRSMLLLAHCLAAFCGGTEGSPGNRQTVSPTLYNNSNRVLGEYYVPGAVLAGTFFGGGGNIVARKST